eukprot:CAMPEP_0113544300 /NCGR_PEP_ID=MMETSP0015_2-20120614/10632_1 /TAXON_ID=2838 /ORGANISM="Odontella" /LENGTH=303 /DNA_ID=CAMNT_0000444545 /DNA_START=86 /DNA_END=994 /DNA_ORIENTATION=- /assembly_acc=CAM_ASM_000160
MNAELLAMLGGQMPPSASSRNREPEGKVILTFKAGKMKTELQPSGKYLVTPDNRRGSIQVVWQAQPASGGSGGGGGGGGGAGGVLKFEWKDRRTRSVVDSLSIFPEDEVTYSKVPTGRDGDRVYLLQYGRASDRRFFFWMQDKEKEGGPEKDAELDEERCVKINTYLSDVDAAKKAAEEAGVESGAAAAGGSGAGAGAAAVDASALERAAGGTLDNAALMQIMQGLGGSGTGAGAAASSGSGAATGSAADSGSGAGGAVQADALSSILQNLNAGSAGGGGGGGEAASRSDGAADSGGESGGGT